MDPAHKFKNAQELQAVLLAGGGGNGLHPLTDEIPKAMLPIGNIPMIEYSLRLLDRHGFPDVIVVVLKSMKEDLVQVLADINNPSTATNRPAFRLNVDIVDIPDDSDMGTADVLREIQPKIFTDFLVLSCDLVTDFALHRLVDVHRVQTSTVSMLLYDPPKQKEAEADKKKKKNQKLDYIGINAADSRVVHFANDSDMATKDDEEAFDIPRYVFQRYPCITFRKDLLDAHLYVFAKEIMQILEVKPKITSIKMELIPFLVRRQFAPHKARPAGLMARHNTMDSTIDGEGETNTSDIDFHALAPVDEFADLYFADRPTSSVKVCAYIATSDECICLRSNTVQSYSDINRQILSHLPSLLNFKMPGNEDKQYEAIHPTYTIAERSQVGADSIVGESTVIGTKCSVKRSILGKHCSVGEKVRITNCIVMDHVQIADNCTLSNTVICTNAYISTNCNLQGCRVGLKHTVAPGTQEKGEELVKQFDF